MSRPPSVEFWRYLSVLTDRPDPGGDLARTFEAHVTTDRLKLCATPTGVRLAMQGAGCFGPAQAEALGVAASVWRATEFVPRPDDDPLPAAEIRAVRKRDLKRRNKETTTLLHLSVLHGAPAFSVQHHLIGGSSELTEL